MAHSTGTGWYSVCVARHGGRPVFPHSDELGKIKFSAHHLPHWLVGLQKKQAAAMADGEMLVCPLGFSVHYGGMATHNHISET